MIFANIVLYLKESVLACLSISLSLTLSLSLSLSFSLSLSHSLTLVSHFSLSLSLSLSLFHSHSLTLVSHLSPFLSLTLIHTYIHTSFLVLFVSPARTKLTQPDLTHTRIHQASQAREKARSGVVLVRATRSFLPRCNFLGCHPRPDCHLMNVPAASPGLPQSLPAGVYLSLSPGLVPVPGIDCLFWPASLGLLGWSGTNFLDYFFPPPLFFYSLCVFFNAIKRTSPCPILFGHLDEI